MRAMVSFLELELEEEEDESEDLEQPVKRKEKIKQERTERTERGCDLEGESLLDSLNGRLRLRLRLGLRVGEVMRSWLVVRSMGEFGIGGGAWSIFLEVRKPSRRGGGVHR